MKYAKLSIETYLNKLAGRTPAPGGGSAAALFGAIGCALLEMVVNYNVRNKRAIKNTAAILKRYRKDFTRLMDEDAKVYNRLSLCYKQYGRDSYKTQQTLKRATLVPLKICSRSYEGMKLCKKLQKTTNKSLISDIGCAKAGFSAAFKSAKLNIGVNIKHVKDKKFINNIRKKITSMR